MRVPAEDGDLGVASRQRHVQLEQEAVQLGFGQLVGALVFDRVLGRGDDERVGQRPGFAVHGDLTLLHRLQQRGLGLRRGAVDLVGQQQIGEHRTRPERERGGARVVDQRAGDVAGHQVGGELHPLEFQLQCGGQGSDQQRLRHSRNTFQQHVAAAQQRDHQAADDPLLPDDGLGELGAQRQQRITRRFGAAGSEREPIAVTSV